MRKDAAELLGNDDENDRKMEGPLYALFMEKMPKYRAGETGSEYLHFSSLANDLNVSRQRVYIWFHNNKIPPHRVNDILALPRAELKMDDVLPFVLKA